MEDTKPADTQSAKYIDKTGISLNPSTPQLISLLSAKSQSLADMLNGAWVVLDSDNNPDKLAQAAHSMRELIEKAPHKMPEIPIQSQSMDESANGASRKNQIGSMVIALAGNDGQISENLLEAQVGDIWLLRSYFLSVCHHGKETTTDEMKQKITDLENILLNLLSPKPIDDLKELDQLISQGELS